jgi:Signal peptidase, peptidase S26
MTSRVLLVAVNCALFAALSGCELRRWDVVVFHPVSEQYRDALWAMRVVGLPGERVSFTDGHVVIEFAPKPRSFSAAAAQLILVRRI